MSDKKNKKLLYNSASELYIVFVLIILIVILTIVTPHFLTSINIRNILLQSTINAIVACGMTYVIISGGIDLSVGSIVAVSGLFLANSLHSGMPLLLAIFIGILIGGLFGLLNGIIISYGKIPPFIVTLGMMSIARGIALLYSGGRPIAGFEASFFKIGIGSILWIPNPIIILLIVYAISFFLLKYTSFGRYIFATGGNEETAILSGINTKLVKTFVYTLSGLASGVASLILVSRLNSAQPIAGYQYELEAIAAVVIGGASLSGGEGKLRGTLIGAMLMGVIRNGLNLLNVSSYAQQVVIGSIIIIAVYIDRLEKK